MTWPRALQEVAKAEREDEEAKRKAAAKKMRQARASLVKEAKAKGLPSPPRAIADRCWLAKERQERQAKMRQERQEQDAAVEALPGLPAVAVEDAAVEAPPGSPAVAAGAAPAQMLRCGWCMQEVDAAFLDTLVAPEVQTRGRCRWCGQEVEDANA